jgi:SAM-dependent methyltransferase
MTPHLGPTVDWPSYLATFHAQRPGITEAVLTRCHHDDRNPYEWLLEDIDAEGRILDLACGNAPTRHRLATRWVGVDRSTAELTAAQHRPEGDLVLADATQLPLTNQAFDTVICAMALMLLSPLGDALDEIFRVLRPGGTLHALLPATRPLTWRDRAHFARLFTALRTRPRFPPSPLDHDAQAALNQAGFTMTTDERRRYAYPIITDADTHLLIDSLYLPNLDSEQLRRAHTRARQWHVEEIGIPLRSITAIRHDTPNRSRPRTAS